MTVTCRWHDARRKAHWYAKLFTPVACRPAEVVNFEMQTSQFSAAVGVRKRKKVLKSKRPSNFIIVYSLLNTVVVIFKL